MTALALVVSVWLRCLGTCAAFLVLSEPEWGAKQKRAESSVQTRTSSSSPQLTADLGPSAADLAASD